MIAIASSAVFVASASASSGSITNVYPNGNGSVSATYTTVVDGCDGIYCSWYPHAWEVPASSACYEDKTYLTYVGGPPAPDYIYSGPASETKTDIFYPHYNPTRICLYYRQGGREHFVADYVYSPPAATPTPTPAPPSAPAPTTQPPQGEQISYVTMTINEARSYVPDVLRKEYGSRFSRSTLTRSCLRASSRKVRCRVAWRKSPYKYSGAVTIWYGDDDAADDYSTYTYSYQIKRKRIRSSTRRSSGGGNPPARPSCNPNYTGACLPLSGDVDCGEISARNFRSVGSDPFRLDGDDDGIACES